MVLLYYFDLIRELNPDNCPYITQTLASTCIIEQAPNNLPRYIGITLIPLTIDHFQNTVSRTL